MLKIDNPLTGGILAEDYGNKAANLYKYVDGHQRLWVAIRHVDEIDCKYFKIALSKNVYDTGSLRFAVRSSSLLEDSATRSYAGHFKTFLNVKYRDIRARVLDVQEHMRQVYRRIMPEQAELLACPVMIQLMVDNDEYDSNHSKNWKYGIYFSRHPVNTDPRPYSELYDSQDKGVGGQGIPISLTIPTVHYMHNRIKDSVTMPPPYECEIAYNFESQHLYILQVRPITI